MSRYYTSAEGSKQVTALKPTVLTCAVTPAKAPIGSSVAINGYLKDSDGNAVIGRTVELYYVPQFVPPKPTGSTFIGTAITNPGGFYLLSWVIPSGLGNVNQTVYAIFPGDSTYQSSSSTETYLSVQWLTRISISAPSPINVNESFYITGVLEYYHETDKVWNPFVVQEVQLFQDGVDTTKRSMTDSSGNYVFSHSFPSAGTYTMTTRYPGTSDHAESVGSMKISTIVPCFIATVAYGSSLAPQLNVFRNFRDRCLPNALVSLYYRLSPPLAKFIKGHLAIRRYARGWLDLLVKLLKEIKNVSYNF